MSKKKHSKPLVSYYPNYNTPWWRIACWFEHTGKRIADRINERFVAYYSVHDPHYDYGLFRTEEAALADYYARKEAARETQNDNPAL